ncbi:MAG TPA: DUF899 domain-containing protein [Myxococcales bacterium]|nr:DUF899 domain-containing protein [Myxococcales bacterium]
MANQPAVTKGAPKRRIVSQSEWLEARKELLAEEKKFTRMRDQLSAKRRALPWLRIDKEYVFEGPNGRETLAELFAGRSQLVVYHFMFAPEWDEGCRGCSFWADNFNGIISHVQQRDVTFVAISRAPLTKLQAFAKRLGWTFKWVSSGGSDFNFDFHVSFKPDDLARGKATYNYAPYDESSPDKEGISVFFKDESGAIFHTYSCFARGLDMMNTAYHYLDLVPKGRDEGESPMSWVKHRDRYDK